MAKNEFTLAFNEVLEEKQLPREIIIKALESAMVSAYRRAVNGSNSQEVRATIDLDTGKVTIFAAKEVVDSVQEDKTEVTLEEARKYDPAAEYGMLVMVECTPKDFGRVAAQTARQVIQQRIRDAERQAQISFYDKQLGEIVNGVIQAITASGFTVGLDMKAEGTLPRKETIPGERFHIHDRVRALVAEVKDSNKGPQIILSRSHRNFLRRLLENEVPEIYHGVVEIRSIAREPGQRAKVAVSATQQGIDPVGACVGIRGVRIQAIVRELHDEKIDVIEWNPDASAFIAKAISPAKVSGVYLNERAAGGKTATVVVPEDQLSLAIGRDGQNARLAAKLTGWRIDIKSVAEAASEALYKVQNDPTLAALFDAQPDVLEKIEEMLARKADGRLLTPEEYDQMARFVDVVERRLVRKTAEKKAEDTEEEALRKTIPASAFQTSILDAGLPEHVAYILQEAGYNTAGDLALQMKSRSDDILRLQGIGPKAMTEIGRFMEAMDAQLAAEVAAAETAAAVVQPEPEAVIEAAPAVETVEVEPIGVVEAAPVEEEPVPVVEEQVAPAAQTEEPIEEEPSFDQLFTLRPEIVASTADLDEEEEVPDTAAKGKKKGKKKGTKYIEYDPDRDMTVVHKKHKRDGLLDWDE